MVYSTNKLGAQHPAHRLDYFSALHKYGGYEKQAVEKKKRKVKKFIADIDYFIAFEQSIALQEQGINPIIHKKDRVISKKQANIRKTTILNKFK
jgi:hypothetical protein